MIETPDIVRPAKELIDGLALCGSINVVAGDHRFRVSGRRARRRGPRERDAFRFRGGGGATRSLNVTVMGADGSLSMRGGPADATAVTR